MTEAAPESAGWLSSGRRRFVVGIGLAALVALFLPEPNPDVRSAGARPHQWQSGVFEGMQETFEARRELGCPETLPSLGAFEVAAETFPARLDAHDFGRLETRLHHAAADVAACPEHAPALVDAFGVLRGRLKDASVDWDLNDRRTREHLYRLIYGGRMAVEEALLQMPPVEMPAMFLGRNEPSDSPSTVIHGVRVHAGDMLVSRGGAPTSALIARGNDLPGNFSHVALVHIDEDGRFSTVEAHIEVGAVVAGLERYEEDSKLRVMLLRPRHQLADDAGERFGLRAAQHARARVQAGHVAYDFAMDWEDPSTLFCSEVAYDAYRAVGVPLWRGRTTTSSQGTARWLSQFGVRTFDTLGPSDLEYDPNLVVVAEWRDPQTLFDDHLDTAVIDGLLATADEGDDVGFAGWRLPLARLAKAYSWVKNQFGAPGPVPEGMSAQVALRVEWLRERHGEVKAQVLARSDAFREEHGYRAPYWELVRMAREVAMATR